MALSGSTLWEVQTGGSDTANSGAFDPSQTAGMFTDGAATSATGAAPVFTSASYNFVAGDAGAWVYIASGTNWTAGWYKIASVAANAATLNGTSGQGWLKANYMPSTATGCATTGSPTGATWSIDYSQQASPKFTYTDLSSTGVGLTVSSAANPFGKQYVGNSIVITGGTNFNTGRYVIASISGTTATVVGPTNIHSVAGTDSDGAGAMGGCLKSIGKVGGLIVTSNTIYIATGTYSITSATANIAGGTFQPTATNNTVAGYGTVRGDLVSPPTLQASGINTFTLVLTPSAGNGIVMNLILDGASATSSRGLGLNRGTAYKVKAINCTNNGIASLQTCILIQCSATGCSTQPAISAIIAIACEAYNNTVTGFSVAPAVPVGALSYCLSYNNSGATSDGFAPVFQAVSMIGCVAYGNGRHGFNLPAAVVMCVNCVAEGHTAGSAKGFAADINDSTLINCAAYNNTTNFTAVVTFSNEIQIGSITGTASFFTNPGSGDFSLNKNTGGGALLRGAGYPGVFPAGTSTGYVDVGAVQHRDLSFGPIGVAGVM